MPMFRSRSRKQCRPSTPKAPCTTSCEKKEKCRFCPSRSISVKRKSSSSRTRSVSFGGSTSAPALPFKKCQYKKKGCKKGCSPAKPQKPDCDQPKNCKIYCPKPPCSPSRLSCPSQCGGSKKCSQGKSSPKRSCSRPGCTPNMRCKSCCKNR